MNRRIDLRQPGLVSIIKDSESLALWECLRRSPRPLDAAALARVATRQVTEVRASLAKLQRAGLVRVLRASGRRRSIAYESTVRELTIVVNASEPIEVERLGEIVRYMERDLMDVHFRHAIPVRSVVPGLWSYHHCSPVALDANDLMELKRRIARVEEFIRLLGQKRSASGPVERCNHAIAIRIEPLGGHVLPQPGIEILSARASEERQRERGLAMQPLTARERQVGRALRDGQTRAEVAQRLGISALTVGTLCKRVYRKLGIRRAADLHHFSFD
jgi:DNA-binding CsgD family transcriptional regulator